MTKFQAFILVFATFLSCEKANSDTKTLFEKIDVPGIYEEADAELVLKQPNGEVYFGQNPFSGYLIKRYPNDSINLKIGYLNGKQNGITTAYYSDGTLKFIRPYLNGEKHGVHEGFYQSGSKKFKYYFEHGFSVGNHLTWYADGQKASDMNYVNGKESGRQQAWRSDGKLRSNYIVRENGRMYGLQGIKRCTKLDGVTKTIDPYKGEGS